MKAFFVLATLTLVLCLGLSLYQHELVHVAVNNKVGFDSRIEFMVHDNMPVLATIREGTQTKELSNLELAHSFNESISYNLTPLLTGIMGILVIGFMAILNKMEVNKQ